MQVIIDYYAWRKTMLYKWLRKQILSTNKGTIAYKMRAKRMSEYLAFYKCKVISELGEDIRRVQILDIGGAERFWVSADSYFRDSADITMLNLESDQARENSEHFFSVVGDATDLSAYADGELDLVFSNSVIEHVGSWENKVKMANEMCRVGKHIYLQTPNKLFPIEPHFTLLFIQFLPRKIQAQIVSFKEKISYERAYEKVCDVNLLTYKDMKKLFPKTKIHRERFCGLTKSFVVYY